MPAHRIRHVAQIKRNSFILLKICASTCYHHSNVNCQVRQSGMLSCHYPWRLLYDWYSCRNHFGKSHSYRILQTFFSSSTVQVSFLFLSTISTWSSCDMNNLLKLHCCFHLFVEVVAELEIHNLYLKPLICDDHDIDWFIIQW